MRLLYMLLPILLIFGIYKVIYIDEKINLNTKPPNFKNNVYTHKPIILVHDVSPLYYNELKEIVKIIDKYHYQNRTYLFVIVNHNNRYNLKNYPKFVEFLHKLEDKGYHIELHGYNHIDGEFNCNKEVAKEKIKKSLEILNACGFNNISYIIPPRYEVSKDAENVMLSYNLTIITKNYIITKTGKIPIENREYTWYLPKSFTGIVFPIAEFDYKMSKYLFYLSIHPKSINYGGGIEFLDEFLNQTTITK
nr:DUF2334 domain-containing protein [Methanotorris formicicus]